MKRVLLKLSGEALAGEDLMRQLLSKLRNRSRRSLRKVCRLVS